MAICPMCGATVAANGPCAACLRSITPPQEFDDSEATEPGERLSDPGERPHRTSQDGAEPAVASERGSGDGPGPLIEGFEPTGLDRAERARRKPKPEPPSKVEPQKSYASAVCGHCHAVATAEDSVYCGACGARLPRLRRPPGDAGRRCHDCGFTNPGTTRSCGNCGSPLA